MNKDELIKLKEQLLTKKKQEERKLIGYFDEDDLDKFIEKADPNKKYYIALNFSGEEFCGKPLTEEEIKSKVNTDSLVDQMESMMERSTTGLSLMGKDIDDLSISVVYYLYCEIGTAKKLMDLFSKRMRTLLITDEQKYMARKEYEDYIKDVAVHNCLPFVLVKGDFMYYREKGNTFDSTEIKDENGDYFDFNKSTIPEIVDPKVFAALIKGLGYDFTSSWDEELIDISSDSFIVDSLLAGQNFFNVTVDLKKEKAVGGNQFTN